MHIQHHWSLRTRPGILTQENAVHTKYITKDSRLRRAHVAGSGMHANAAARWKFFGATHE